MATVTLLGTATWSTAAGDKTVTATPTLNDLIVVVSAGSGLDSVPVVTDNQSGTYTTVEQGSGTFANTNGICIAIRNALVASAVSTIYTSGQTGSSGGGLAVYRVSGMTRTGASANRGSGGTDAGTGITPTATLDQAALTGNALVGGLMNNTSPAGLTPPAGFTEDADLGYATPTSGFEVVNRDSGETGSVITWGSNSATNWWTAMVELDTSAAADEFAQFHHSDRSIYPGPTAA